MQPLSIEQAGRVQLLRMDRPPANATGLPLRVALAAALEAFAHDSAVDAAVLIGTGRFFSAGADIGELGTPDNQREPRIRTVIDALESSAKPIVAAINGIAASAARRTAPQCLEASIGKAFNDGMRLEYELALDLIQSPEAKMPRQEFSAGRAESRKC